MSGSDNSKPKLVLPPGLQLALGEDGLSIAHDGDVEIHGPLGMGIARLEGGSIVLHGDFEIAHVQSSGGVDVRGKLKARQLHADGAVSLREGGEIKALHAGGGVSLSGAFTLGSVASGGDIRLDGAGSTASLSSQGSVELSGNQQHQELSAAGTLSLSGTQEAQLIRGGVVKIGAGSLNAKGIEGRRQVVLGPAKLGVEAVIAPEVNVDAGTTGRVNVVESNNELGPNGLKGGFRLSEYAEFTGVDPDAFLKERGVRSLAELAEAPEPEIAESSADDSPEQSNAASTLPGDAIEAIEEPQVVEVLEAVEVVEAVEAVEADEAELEQPTGGAMQVQVAAEPEAEEIELLAAAPADEDAHAPAAVSINPINEQRPIQVTPMEVATQASSLSSDSSPTVVEIDDEDDELLEPDNGPQVSPEVREALNSAVLAVSASYAGVEEPEAVGWLRNLVHGEDYVGLRDEITAIWKDLIQHHQQRGKRIPHKVTATFNRINSIVRKL